MYLGVTEQFVCIQSLIIRPRVDKFFAFFPFLFFKPVSHQLATFVEILAAKYIFLLPWQPKRLQLGAL